MPPIDRNAISDLVGAIFEEVYEAGSEEYDQLLPLLRLLVSGIIVQPLEGDGKKQEYRLEVTGRVATILAAAEEWKTTGRKMMEDEKLAADDAEAAVTSLERKHAWQSRSASSIAEESERLAYLQMSVVAGAGSNLHLLPEQVKMVAGTGVDHNLRSTPVKMVAGGRNHLYLQASCNEASKVTAEEAVGEVQSFLTNLFQTAA